MQTARFLAAVGVLLGAPAFAQSSEAAAPPAAIAIGRVLDDDGRPIPTATIGIRGREPVPCGADGRFRCAIPPRTEIPATSDLRIVAAGRVSYRWPLLPILNDAGAAGGDEPPTFELGDVVLPRGITLRGVVRAAGGPPLAGAEVAAFDEFSGHSLWQPGYGGTATTGERGRFALRGMFGGAVRLHVDHPGHYREVRRGVAVGTPLDIELEPSGFVEGPLPVLANGEPFDGWLLAHVEYPSIDRERERAAGSTYRVGITHRARFRISARDPATGRRWETAVLTGPARNQPMLPIAPPGSRLAVRVIDADTGAAVPAAAAVRWLSMSRLPQSMRDRLIEAVADAAISGAPTVPLPTAGSGAKGWVAVRAEGYAGAIQPVTYEADTAIEVRLAKAGRVSGIVLDTAGAPVAGCPVEWSAAGAVASRGIARTGSDGRFAIAGLDRARYRVTAARSAIAPRVSNVAELRKVATVQLQLTLPDGVDVSGEVTGIEIGAGYRIVLRPTGRRAATSGRRSNAARWELAGTMSVPLLPDGGFEIQGCEPSDWRFELYVPAPPRGGEALYLPLAERAVDGSQRIELDATDVRPGIVEGTLALTGARVPPGRLAVLVRPIGRRRTQERQPASAIRWQLVEGEGRFRIAMAAGEYRLQVRDCLTGVAITTPTDEEAFVLESGATLTRDLELPVVPVTVEFTGEDTRFVDHLRIDAGGRAGPHGFESEEIPFGVGTWGMPGYFVEGQPGPVRFFVPPGIVNLVLDGATRLGEGVTGFGAKRGAMTVEAVAGEPLEVEFAIAPPADLGERGR